MSRTLIAFLILASAASAQARTSISIEAPRRSGWIVELHRSATLEQFRRDVASLERRAAAKGAANPIRHEYRRALFGAAVNVPDETAQALRRLSYVRAVHPDLEVKSCAIATTSTIDAATRVNAASLQVRGEGIRIGVLDTGIDYNHPALGGGFGEGYKVAGGWNFVSDNADPLDLNGHGTHVAGILAASSPELSGVAPAATLIAYKVLDDMGRGAQSDIIAAIERSIDPNQDGDPSDHLDVINLSLGGIGNADDPPSRAIDNATAAGVIVVVAAGNEGEFASVRSPGTARSAITVGAVDDNGAVTEFSSRGPAPATIALKPDVMAPGLQIPSARAGGGLLVLNGTSMSTPHVAGVAALLAQLHPDWTPAQVKSALITTATRTPGSIFERAAGLVDAARAANATSFISDAGISFGLAPGTTDSSTLTRSLTITNRGTEARTWQIAATNVPGGATFSSTPQTLQLAPGASQNVEVRLTVRNDVVAIPENYAFGGDIEFRGADAFAVPWLALRAARLTFAYEGFLAGVVGISEEAIARPLPYDVGAAELFARPQSKWDAIVTSVEYDERGNPSETRLMIVEDRVLSGDDRIELTRASASAEIAIDGRDRQNRHLGKLEDIMANRDYFLTLAFDYRKGSRAEEIQYYLGSWSRLFITPASSSFPLYVFESLVDLPSGEAYNVQHPVISSITQSKTLTANRSTYRHARFRLNDQEDPQFAYLACTTNGIRSGLTLGLHSIWCYSEEIAAAKTVDYFTTVESYEAGSGVMFVTGGFGEINGAKAFLTRTIVPPLRGLEDGIATAEFSASPAGYRIAEGEEVVFENSARFPLAFFGTTGGFASDFLREGISSSLGEFDLTATHGTAWTLFDAQNSVKTTGVVRLDGPPQTPPLPEPRERFLAVRDGLRVAGLSSRAELEVAFGANGDDLIAPTLTSLRIVNATGRLATRVDRNTSAALHFSAADLSYWQDVKTRVLRSASTRVWYRVSGTSAWIAVPVVITGIENGSFSTIGRPPAGDMYRADLTAATTFAAPIDLRVQVEDVFGNISTWTQSPAFVVGAPKRRSVR